MTRIKFDENLIKTMSFFERITRSKLKDCIQGEGSILFIVDPGFIGKAVGKRGVNVAKLEKALNRKIKIVEFNPDVLLFVKNMIYPLKVKDIEKTEQIITITGPDVQTKAKLIGRNGQNLRKLESIIKRYNDIMEIKVV